jgi:DMSO/TMAO reductase YedYZ molybdopterin-dependent catalytic subunit
VVRIQLLAGAIALALSLVQQPNAPAKNSLATELKIWGDVVTPLTLSASDLKNMPRQTLKVVNPHEKKEEVYEGVAVRELLRSAGVPQNDKLRGRAMAIYVVAEASDGYRVVFSLAELDSDFQDSEVIVADTLNSSPLGEKQGPFKMVAPHDKRPARWIRMLKSLTVQTAPAGKP